MVEILVVMVVLSILVPPLTQAVQNMVRFSTRALFESRAAENSRPMDVLLEQDLNEMVSLKVATPDLIEFIMDSNRLKTYDPKADPDGDTLSNDVDPDDDNDVSSWVSPNQWPFRGNDLDDDDDDGDGQEDLRVRYRFVGDQLFRETNVNEGGWNSVGVGRGISFFRISYYGTNNKTTGTILDTNGDGLVSWDEIDSLVGNNNGVPMDTPKERANVFSIEVLADFDLNKDAIIDSRFQKTISPALKPFRRDWP